MTGIRSTGGAALLATLLTLGGASGAAPRPHAAAAATDPTTLIYGSPNEPDTLNPRTTVGNSLDIAIFDTLLAVDQQGRLQPALATSVAHSADGRTWTFHLRHGVRWADGQPFTSADVAYNDHVTFDKKANVGNTAGWDLIDRSSAPDAYTFVCHLRAVNAPFLTNVGLTPIVPAHIYGRPGVDFTKTPFNRAPFGTGPYMVTQWKTADHITLVANPYYWGVRPAIRTLIWKIVPTRDTLLVQLRTGEVDAGGVLPRQLAAARALPGKRVARWLNNSYKGIDFVRYGFLGEKVVRQALDDATPKQAIFTGILQGQGLLATSNVSPLLTPYYNPNVPRHPFNLDKAAALLAADGFTKGPDGVLQKQGQPFALTLWADNDTNGQRLNEVLQQEWGRLGIKVTLRMSTQAALYSPTGPYFTQAMAGVTVDNGNNPDPDDSLNWISAGIPKSPTDQTCCNTRGYFHKLDAQARIDALYVAGNGTVDLAKRRAIYAQIQALLADEVPVIFLYWEPSQAVIPADLRGFAGNTFATWPLWNIATWRRG